MPRKRQKKKRKREQTARTEALDGELDAARRRLRDLVKAGDDSSAAAYEQARQLGRVWTLTALRCQLIGDIEDAAKASAQAIAAGKLAGQLIKADLPDRVAALELREREARTRGSKIRALAQGADQQAKSPGADPLMPRAGHQ